MMKRVRELTVVVLVLGGCGGAGTEEAGSREQAASQEEASGGTVHAQSCPASSNETSSTGCMNYDDWKKYSIAYCQGFGSQCVASSTSPFNSCGGDLFSSATITCVSF